jgi:hypothetical protein
MSFDVTAAVWRRSRARGAAKLVLLALANYANRDGGCYPSVAALVGKTGLSRRAVQDGLRQLEALGEIVTARGGGRRRPSEYRITLVGAPGRNGPVSAVSETPETAQEMRRIEQQKGAAGAPFGAAKGRTKRAHDKAKKGALPRARTRTSQ